MKRTLKTVLTLILAIVMVVCAGSVTVFAQTGEQSEPTYVSDFKVEDSTGKLISSVTAKNGGIADTYKLNFRDVTPQFEYFESEKIFGEGKVGYVISAYDMYFSTGGVKYSIDGEFEIKLLLPTNTLQMLIDFLLFYTLE